MKPPHLPRILVAASLVAGVSWIASGCGGESGDHASALEISQTRIAKISQSMLAYANDWDSTLPPKNWIDATESYTKDPDAYRSPAVGGEGYGYAFNQDLVGKSLTKIADRPSTILIFDSTVLTRNAVAPTSTLPQPARYGTENTIAYADGSVKNALVKDAYGEASSRLRQIGVGLLSYATDFDDRMPQAKNWMDSLKPYVTTDKIFHDPSLPANEFGFALNKELIGKQTFSVGPVASTPIVFTSTLLGRNAVGGLDTLPTPGRYDGKNAIYYLDGHVSDQVEKAIDPPKAASATPVAPKSK